MSDSGFAFHRNGNITYTDPRSGETYTIYLPRIGEWREIEEHRVMIREQLESDPGRKEIEERIQAVHQALADARDEKGEDLTNAELNDIITGMTSDDEEAEELMKSYTESVRDRTLRWFVKVVEVCGSDNWPKAEDGTLDVDVLPMTIRNRQLARDISDHWGNVPLAESPNGATTAKIEAVS